MADKNNIEIMLVEKVDLDLFNLIFFILGMVMVWSITHSAWVLFWTWVASIHMRATLRKKINEQPRSKG